MKENDFYTPNCDKSKKWLFLNGGIRMISVVSLVHLCFLNLFTINMNYFFMIKTLPVNFFYSLETSKADILPHCFCSGAKSCLTLCSSMECSMPGSSILLEFAQIHVHWVSDASEDKHLILCCLLLLLPSIFPRIRIYSNESALSIRWPKY